MPIETRTFMQILMIVVPIIVSILASAWVIAQKIGKLEERVEVMNGSYSRVHSMEIQAARFDEAITFNKEFAKRLAEDVKNIRDHLKIEIDRTRKAIENARRYMREQTTINNKKIDDHLIPHINNVQLHSKQMKFESRR